MTTRLGRYPLPNLLWVMQNEAALRNYWHQLQKESRATKKNLLTQLAAFRDFQDKPSNSSSANFYNFLQQEYPDDFTCFFQQLKKPLRFLKQEPWISADNKQEANPSVVLANPISVANLAIYSGIATIMRTRWFFKETAVKDYLKKIIKSKPQDILKCQAIATNNNLWNLLVPQTKPTWFFGLFGGGKRSQAEIQKDIDALLPFTRENLQRATPQQVSAQLAPASAVVFEEKVMQQQAITISSEHHLNLSVVPEVRAAQRIAREEKKAVIAGEMQDNLPGVLSVLTQTIANVSPGLELVNQEEAAAAEKEKKINSFKVTNNGIVKERSSEPSKRTKELGGFLALTEEYKKWLKDPRNQNITLSKFETELHRRAYFRALKDMPAQNQSAPSSPTTEKEIEQRQPLAFQEIKHSQLEQGISVTVKDLLSRDDDVENTPQSEQTSHVEDNNTNKSAISQSTEVSSTLQKRFSTVSGNSPEASPKSLKVGGEIENLAVQHSQVEEQPSQMTVTAAADQDQSDAGNMSSNNATDTQADEATESQEREELQRFEQETRAQSEAEGKSESNYDNLLSDSEQPEEDFSKTSPERLKNSTDLDRAASGARRSMGIEATLREWIEGPTPLSPEQKAIIHDYKEIVPDWAGQQNVNQMVIAPTNQQQNQNETGNINGNNIANTATTADAILKDQEHEELQQETQAQSEVKEESGSDHDNPLNVNQIVVAPTNQQQNQNETGDINGNNIANIATTADAILKDQEHEELQQETQAQSEVKEESGSDHDNPLSDSQQPEENFEEDSEEASNSQAPSTPKKKLSDISEGKESPESTVGETGNSAMTTPLSSDKSNESPAIFNTNQMTAVAMNQDQAEAGNNSNNVTTAEAQETSEDAVTVTADRENLLSGDENAENIPEEPAGVGNAVDIIAVTANNAKARASLSSEEQNQVFARELLPQQKLKELQVAASTLASGDSRVKNGSHVTGRVRWSGVFALPQKDNAGKKNSQATTYTTVTTLLSPKASEEAVLTAITARAADNKPNIFTTVFAEEQTKASASTILSLVRNINNVGKENGENIFSGDAQSFVNSAAESSSKLGVPPAKKPLCSSYAPSLAKEVNNQLGQDVDNDDVGINVAASPTGFETLHGNRINTDVASLTGSVTPVRNGINIDASPTGSVTLVRNGINTDASPTESVTLVRNGINTDASPIESVAPIRDGINTEVVSPTGSAMSIKNGINTEVSSLAGSTTRGGRNVINTEVASPTGSAMSIKNGINTEISSLAGSMTRGGNGINTEVASLTGSVVPVRNAINIEVASPRGSTGDANEGINIDASPSASSVFDDEYQKNLDGDVECSPSSNNQEKVKRCSFPLQKSKNNVSNCVDPGTDNRTNRKLRFSL